jgi:hypothetical protein
MTDKQINAAIAEACGWTVDKRGFGWLNPNGCYTEPPDYCSDLNAMHEAEDELTFEDWELYCDELGGSLRGCAHATARHRAEAFLRTLGKWEEVE